MMNCDQTTSASCLLQNLALCSKACAAWSQEASALRNTVHTLTGAIISYE